MVAGVCARACHLTASTETHCCAAAASVDFISIVIGVIIIHAFQKHLLINSVAGHLVGSCQFHHVSLGELLLATLNAGACKRFVGDNILFDQ